MTTIEGRCDVGVNLDTAAVEDWDVFARCLHEGFEEVLASGDHAEIAAWRSDQALVRTRERRPDLVEASRRRRGDKA